KNSRFRRHPFKDGNMTVTLSNYDIEKKGRADPSKWLVSVQYGCGEGFPTYSVEEDFYLELEPIIRELKGGTALLNDLETLVIKRTANATELQRLYELQRSEHDFLEPTELVEVLGRVIESHDLSRSVFVQNGTKV